MDLDFYEQLPKLFPHVDAKSWFVGKDAYIESTAFRNSALQGAYLTMAVRALGLDCGAMSGFDADKVNAEFFPDGRVKVNFLLNIGYGNSASLMPRQPRPSFAEVCRIL
jgi:3-hydroxypropanoate dehydrogenase